jgi:hypothetical protein
VTESNKSDMNDKIKIGCQRYLDDLKLIVSHLIDIWNGEG